MLDVWMLAMGVVAMVAIPSAIWSACAAAKGLVEPKEKPNTHFHCSCGQIHPRSKAAQDSGTWLQCHCGVEYC